MRNDSVSSGNPCLAWGNCTSWMETSRSCESSCKWVCAWVFSVLWGYGNFPLICVQVDVAERVSYASSCHLELSVLATVSGTVTRFSLSSFTVHPLEIACIHIWKHSAHSVFHLRALLFFYYSFWEEYKQIMSHLFSCRKVLLGSVN